MHLLTSQRPQRSNRGVKALRLRAATLISQNPVKQNVNIVFLYDIEKIGFREVPRNFCRTALFSRANDPNQSPVFEVARERRSRHQTALCSCQCLIRASDFHQYLVFRTLTAVLRAFTGQGSFITYEKERNIRLFFTNMIHQNVSFTFDCRPTIV